MSNAIEKNPTNLIGQVAVVTGGGRGMGRAFVQALAAAGAAVAVVARSEDQLADTVSSITATGGRARAFAADVSDQQAVTQMVHAVEHDLGDIDLLINNAGTIAPLGPIGNVDPIDWWRCLEINLRGPFLCTNMILPGMITRGRGRIINTVSTGALIATANSSAYNVSKTALMRLTEQVAIESQELGVCAFAINPGPVRTAMTDYLMGSEAGQQWLPWYRERFDALEIPVERVVALVLFLASGHADQLTGRFISVFDDVAELTRHAETIEKDDLYTLRLRITQPGEEATETQRFTGRST